MWILCAEKPLSAHIFIISSPSSADTSYLPSKSRNMLQGGIKVCGKIAGATLTDLYKVWSLRKAWLILVTPHVQGVQAASLWPQIQSAETQDR